MLLERVWYVSVNGRIIEKTDDIMQKQFLYIEKIKEIIAEKTAIDKKQSTYDLRVYGCQMNEHDAEKLAGMLEEMGYVKAGEGEPADIVIFETCCVRENAEEKIYGHLGSLKPHIRPSWQSKTANRQKQKHYSHNRMHDAAAACCRKDKKIVHSC